MMDRVTIWLFLACLCVAGCKAENLSDQPPADDRTSQSVEVIRQVLSEQAKPPAEIEVTDKYFKTIGDETASPEGRYVYYQSIESTDLYEFQDWYLVLIKEKGGSVVYHMRVKNQKRGEQFIDAINMLREQGE